MDVAGHDADLELVGRDHARTVRTNEQRLLPAHAITGADHVAHRYAFGDADDEIEPRIDRLVDRRRGERRWHVDHRHRRAGRLLRIRHRAEYRNAFEVLARFLRVDSGDKARAPIRIRAAGLRMELPRLAGDALRHHPGVLVDQDAHRLTFTAATTFSAASPMLSAEMIGRPESRSIFLPSSSFVPFMRTTSGSESFTSRAALTTPLAMVSHFMMPPKMLTRIAFTLRLESMILNAAVTLSAVAPPPTSRKLAGWPP